MGRGNYIPSNEIKERGYDMVYVDIESDETYETLIEEIRTILPKSFIDVTKEWDDQRHDYIQVISKNGLFKVGISDNENSYAVIIYVKENAPMFAASNLPGIADKLFNHLSNIFKLSIRKCAWTSGPYIKR